MFGRRQRHEERLYWEGFRDALMRGARNPGLPECGPAIAELPRYPQGFEDGKRAAQRIHRDALISEVSRLSLKPGDKLVVRCKDDLSPEAVERISETLKPRFPDNEILVFPPDLEPSVIRPESIVVQSVLDGKVIAKAVAELGNDEAARS